MQGSESPLTQCHPVCLQQKYCHGLTMTRDGDDPPLPVKPWSHTAAPGAPALPVPCG